MVRNRSLVNAKWCPYLAKSHSEKSFSDQISPSVFKPHMHRLC